MAIPESGKSNGVCGIVNSVAIYYEKGANGNAFLRKEKFRAQGAHFSKVPRTLRARKAIRKITTCLSVKLIFSHAVKGIKIKITAKFRASRRLRFEDTKRIMSPEIRPKSFGTFEKQAPAF